MLGLFFRVQVVEVAEELVEAVIGGEMLVQVTKVVLAELPGDVTLVLQETGDGGVLLREAFLRPRQPDL
jgi:hypothetical protein